MRQSDQQSRDITVFVDRYDPHLPALPAGRQAGRHGRERSPRWRQQYTLRVEPGMTVLEGLHALKEAQDPTLCYRFSCRMGVCGSCGMMINGKLSLACNTQIQEVASRVLTVAPMPNFDVVRDLVPDLGRFFLKHRDIQPWLQREDQEELENPTGEYFQTPEQVVSYLQFSYCIRCGLCVAACPTVATDDGYLGPMALAQAHRYNTDTRDGGFHSRKQVAALSGGAFSCHYAGECSSVCPKGVDPARAIQFLKRSLVWDYLRLRRERKPSPLLGPPERAEPHPDIPKPPPHTVEPE